MLNFVRRQPVPFAVVITLVRCVLPLLLWWLVTRLSPNLNDNGLKWGSQLVLAALVVFLLGWLGWWRESGVTRLMNWSDLRVFGLPALVPILGMAGIRMGNLDGHTLGFSVLYALVIGFSEEAFFRGLLVHSLLPTGRVRAAVIAAVLFGLSHLPNLWAGQDPVSTLVQVLAATLWGFGMAVIWLRVRSIWPLVTLHAVTDTVAFLTLSGATLRVQPPAAIEIVGFVSLQIVLVGYALFLLRKLLLRPEPVSQLAS